MRNAVISDPATCPSATLRLRYSKMVTRHNAVMGVM